VQHGLEVELLVAGGDLEADARRPVGIEDQLPLAEHADAQIDGCAVEHHELDRQAETAFEQGFEVERGRVELRRNRYTATAPDVASAKNARTRDSMSLRAMRRVER
jgi:hypothetical protein